MISLESNKLSESLSEEVLPGIILSRIKIELLFDGEFKSAVTYWLKVNPKQINSTKEALLKKNSSSMKVIDDKETVTVISKLVSRGDTSNKTTFFDIIKTHVIECFIR